MEVFNHKKELGCLIKMILESYAPGRKFGDRRNSFLLGTFVLFSLHTNTIEDDNFSISKRMECQNTLLKYIHSYTNSYIHIYSHECTCIFK